MNSLKCWKELVRYETMSEKRLFTKPCFCHLQTIKTWTQGRLPFTFDVCVAITTAKQEAELEEFKSALAALYSDIQGAPL